jgi:hypothetical protein
MLGARLVSIGLGFGVMGHWVFTISLAILCVNDCQFWLVLFGAWFVLARDNSKCFAPSNLQRAFLLRQVALALTHTHALIGTIRV